MGEGEAEAEAEGEAEAEAEAEGEMGADGLMNLSLLADGDQGETGVGELMDLAEGGEAGGEEGGEGDDAPFITPLQLELQRADKKKKKKKNVELERPSRRAGASDEARKTYGRSAAQGKRDAEVLALASCYDSVHKFLHTAGLTMSDADWRIPNKKLGPQRSKINFMRQLPGVLEGAHQMCEVTDKRYLELMKFARLMAYKADAVGSDGKPRAKLDSDAAFFSLLARETRIDFGNTKTSVVAGAMKAAQQAMLLQEEQAMLMEEEE